MTAIEAIEETLARVGQRGKVCNRLQIAALFGFRLADPPSSWTQVTTSQRGYHRIRYIGI